MAAGRADLRHGASGSVLSSRIRPALRHPDDYFFGESACHALHKSHGAQPSPRECFRLGDVIGNSGILIWTTTTLQTMGRIPQKSLINTPKINHCWRAGSLWLNSIRMRALPVSCGP